MICSKCGKQLAKGCLFCTECGNAVNTVECQSQSTDKTINNRLINEITGFIKRFGDREICKYLSVAVMVSMIFIWLLGFVFVTVLTTAINAFLIYYNYKCNKRLDTRMLAFGIAVVLVGILIII